MTPSLGPDATGVGWVYAYILESDNHDLAQLRTIQDWFLRYDLTSVSGVAEVASIGGFVKQYQIILDPNKLLAYNMPLQKVRMAVRRSNNNVGGGVVEMGETEFMVRGLGYIRNIEDIQNIPVGADARGTPILLRNVADVKLGPELRRGLADYNGEGEVVGGIVVMRFGENALQVIATSNNAWPRSKSGCRRACASSGLRPLRPDPAGHRHPQAHPDRGKRHRRPGLHSLSVPLPQRPGGHFHPAGGGTDQLHYHERQGINANIMSLGGIAIAVGVMVDAAIVMIENAHKHIEHATGEKPHWELIADAAKEVGPSLFFSLVIIAVSFLPVFTLEAQEGRLFRPLAFTKTYAMLGSAVLAITIVPVLMGYLIRGRIRPERENPINRFLIWVYHPLIKLVLKAKILVAVLAVVVLALTWVPLQRLGSEFMPPLNEGDLLYMPTTLPGISITKAKELLQQTDRIIARFPEVEDVFGKVGRADTATDPAPLSMIETTITLKPESQWRPGMTVDKLIQEMDKAIHFPGLTNAWTMPIKARTDMLSTGIKTPVGIKLMGADLQVLSDLGGKIEAVIRNVPHTLSVYAERTTGGNYFDYRINREAAARYGLTVDDVEAVIVGAIGGMNITQTVEGLKRFPVNLRYGSELRDTPARLARILVPTPSGAQIPITQVADIRVRKGPPVIKTENARKSAWIYVDLSGIDVGTYVRSAQAAVQANIRMPAGYSLVWSGQYEYMVRAQQRLMLVVPMTLVIILLLLYLNFRSIPESLIVMLSVPFALTGGIWLMYLLDYHLSVAVGVGFIALAGVAAETGVVMLIYLDLSYDKYRRRYGRDFSRRQLALAIEEGAALRVRPKIMTVVAIMAGLMPIMWSHGTGSSVMKRIAAPMVGGMVSATILTLMVVPAIYGLWKGWGLPRHPAPSEGGNPSPAAPEINPEDTNVETS